MALTETEQKILLLEDQRWLYPAVKAHVILETFGWSMARYHQVVNTLIDRADVEAEHPVLVHRLRRLRETRQRARSSRRSGFDISA